MVNPHFPGLKERAELIAYIKQYSLEMSSGLKEDNWDVIDRTIIQIKSKAKTLGLEPTWFICTEFPDLWEMLQAKVKKEAERTIGTPNIPLKELEAILILAFDRYPEERMTKGLKEPLERWLAKMKGWLDRLGRLPFRTDGHYVGTVHYGPSG